MSRTKVRLPLGVEAGPPTHGRPGHPVVVLHVLGDGQLPRLAGVDASAGAREAAGRR
jgi:hypothetical protein